MRVYMKRNRLSLPIAAFVAMAASGSALAANSTNLNVNFTATILETTCNMKLVGGQGSDTVQTLTIGNANGEVRLDDVRNNAATANFQIVIVECPASLSSLKTTVTGTPSGYLLTGLTNSLAKGTGVSDYAAVTIARQSDPAIPFTINSAVDVERLVWTKTEIDNKAVPLVATLQETKAGSLTVGRFEATAVFEFEYE